MVFICSASTIRFGTKFKRTSRRIQIVSTGYFVHPSTGCSEAAALTGSQLERSITSSRATYASEEERELPGDAAVAGGFA